MRLSPFRNQSLENCIKVGDSGRYKIDLAADKDKLFTETRERLENQTINFPHKTIEINKGRKLHIIEDYHSVLALRATAKALNREFGINTPNRHEIVKGVLETVFDSTPSHVIRCDIASFFENVNAEHILNELKGSTKLHPHLKLVLAKLEESSLITSASKGVPRGLGLSTTFAEMRLRDFDREVKLIDGVYRYFRFADDILIFTVTDPQSVLDKAKNILGPELPLNDKKSGPPIPLKSLPDTKEKPCREKPSEFSYLGYKFSCQNGIKAKKSRRVVVSVSDNKIATRKTRVILSLRAFKKDRNAALLIKRIRFLTSNYEIRKSGHSHGVRKAYVRTGIFYSYQHCGNYEHKINGPELTEAQPDELKALDGFLNSILWGKSSEFREVLDKKLRQEEIKQLKKLSFYKGFTEKITLRFKRKEVSEIRKAWRYA